jgi:hypothetical protein
VVLKARQTVSTGAKAIAVTALSVAFLPLLGAGPAAASDITFSGLPTLGAPGQSYTITASGAPGEVITASIVSEDCDFEGDDQDAGSGLDFISVAVDPGDVLQLPGTCTITAADSSGSATASFNTEGQDEVSFTSAPPAPSPIGGTYLVGAISLSGNPESFSIGSSSTDDCTVGTTEGDEATVTFGDTPGNCIIHAAVASGGDWVGASASQTVTVTPGTVSIEVSGSQAFGSSSPTFTYTTSPPSGLIVAGTLTCSVLEGSTALGPSLPAGSYTMDGSSCSGLSLTGTGASDYAISYSGVANGFVVAPALLSITASSPAMTYGGTVPAITPIYSGFVNGDNATSLTTAPTCSTTASSSSPAGSYPSTCSGAADPNYTISYVAGSVSVGQQVLTITATSATMTYGGTVPVITPIYSASTVDLASSPTCSTTATLTSTAGAYSSTCSGAADPDFAIGYVAGTVTVTPAPLTITATSATMTYGGTVPVITPIYNGFVNGNGPASLSTDPTCSTTATSSSPPGSYPSTCSGASGPDYTVSFVAGTVTVTAAPASSPGAPVTTTTTATSAPPLQAFPHADASYPNGAIVAFGGNDYVLAGGRAFLAPPGALSALAKVDPARVLNAPAGATPPTAAVLRPGTLFSTRVVNGSATIYVAGTDGELHGFSTSHQFFADGYDAALVVTVPSLDGLRVGATDGVAGAAMTALATRADGAIVDSSGTFYVFAGGRAFGISTPAELVGVQKADPAEVLVGSVGPPQRGAAIAAGALISAPGKVYVSYQGALYLFKTLAQLANDGYGGTAAAPVGGTGGLSVVVRYSGS